MRFVDLPDTDWSYSFVAYLYCHGVISGYADNTFRGVANANRGQLAKMVTLGLNWPLSVPETPTFSDVPPESPYYLYVETVYAHGVVSGYNDGTFRPFASITRAQLSKMIVLAKGWALLFPEPPSFTDVPSDYWGFGFIEAVRAQGVVAGYADHTFRPGNEATRSQLSKMLSTAFQLPDGPPPTPTGTPTAIVTATLAAEVTGTPTVDTTATPTVEVTGTPTADVTGTVTPLVTRTVTPVPATATTGPSATATTTVHP